MAGKGTREVALLALSACEKQGAWSDGFLKKAIRDSGMDSRDAALCTRLCFGVLQNKLYLDDLIGRFCDIKLKKLENKVLQALRLGVYQMRFLTRIPHSAAVNESVNLARRYAKNPRAAGLVNGVLRSLSRAGEELPEPDDLSIRYSHPAWITNEWIQMLGEEGAEALLAADNGQPPTAAQVNLCRTTEEELTARLSSQGVTVERHPWLPGCVLLSGTGDLEQLPAFRDGLFYVQDPAARLAVLAAGPEPGMRVLDACAAPGGKSFAAAVAMGDKGDILSCDIHAHKKALIEAGAARLGFTSIMAEVMDGKVCQDHLLDSFDLVIADVPCSGLGIIRKKPDIRYKDPEPLKHLPAVQSAILDNVAQYVKPGGVLLYATCTLLERENRAVAESFLSRHSNFTAEAFQLPDPIGRVDTGMLTLWPHIHDTDGFFFAKLRRKGLT